MQPAALTSVNQYGNNFSMAGFVHSISNSGVESFGYKTLYTGGRYNGLAGYENSVLLRHDVTSLTFEVYGDGGAAAQFTFFIFSEGSRDGRGDGGKEGGDVSPRDWSAQHYRTALGFDRRKNELLEVHKIYGDDKFIESKAEEWLATD